ncbi:MFS transporter [uncultured Desulfobacter sp.]|uniref:MFS transporter n=1 Tax=uncultured Desulfobacter sp. TaxID=240139 RepID=UPI0029F4DB19|nr:MFS transporter [uncultured Desulfobacter sp.]
MQQKKIFYGWTIVAVAFLIGLTQAGVFQNVLSIFLKPMADEFGWNRSIITGSIAVGSLSGGILSPLVGPYLDRNGPRKAAFWGITILSAGLIALSQLSSVWQLYLFFGTGRMIASGLLALVVTVSVSNWFIEKRGRAMGISQLGSRIGIAFLPLLVQHIILSYGWRTAWAVLGIIVFAFSALPSLIFLKRRPEDVGLLPDGREPAERLEADEDKSDKPNKAVRYNLENEPVWTRQTAFRTVSFWQLVFVMCVIYLVGAGSNFHMFPFMTDQGLPATTAVLVITVLSVCAALGGVLFGFLAEKISVKILMGGVLITIAGLFFSVFWAVKKPAWMFIFAVVYGIIRGGVLPLIFLIWTEFYGRRSSGTVLGIAGPFRMAANAAGPVSAAIFFDLFHNYWIPFSAFTILLIMAGLVCLIAKPPVSPELTSDARQVKGED